MSQDRLPRQAVQYTSQGREELLEDQGSYGRIFEATTGWKPNSETEEYDWFIFYEWMNSVGNKIS